MLANRESALRNLVISIALATCSATNLTSDEFENVPLCSSITHVQPMTGIVLWTDHDQVDTDSISLEYRYCGYDEIVKANGQYDYSKFEKILDEASKRKHQAVIRFNFVYPGKKTTVPEFILNKTGYKGTIGTSEGKRTHFCDWSNSDLQEFTLEFYTRLAKRYDKDPRIAYLQTGFGLWAEYHIYDGPLKLGTTFPTKEYQTRFLKHMDQSFTSLPWSVSVDAADYDYSPLEDNDELLRLNFGVFDDSFLCKQHPNVNAMNWEILSPDRWKRSPGGGELSYYNQRDQKLALSKNGPNKVSFPNAAEQFHVSYMIGNDQPKYRTMEEIKSASMATGYRFRVTSAKSKGNTLYLKITNEGVAPLYRDAFFAAGKEEAMKRTKTTLKGLLPTESLECVIEDVDKSDLEKLSIQCDAILSSQVIQFEADLP